MKTKSISEPGGGPAAGQMKQSSQVSDSSIDFDEVYRLYGERVLNMAYRMTGSPESARDLTQDIFVKVYENLDKFQGQSHIYTWIYRIATNHILNFLKKNKHQSWYNLIDQNVADVFREDAMDPSFWGRNGPPAPDKKLENQERQQIIQKIIRTLPLKHQVPFLLQRFEGMSYSEIAETLGISQSAVETRIHRARKALIEKIKPILEQLY